MVGRIYESDKCGNTRIPVGVVAGASASTVTIYVANNFIRVVNDVGMNQPFCRRCLYALNGQSDTGSKHGPNEDVFVAINRVVHASSGRTGAGVCWASVNWVCPDPTDYPFC